MLEGVELEGCRFDGSVMEGAALRGCTFTDCVFTGCNLSRVDLDGSRLVDCRFVDCKALAVVWTRAAPAALSARPWDFERCRLDLASFQEGRARRQPDGRLLAARGGLRVARTAEPSTSPASDLAGAVFVDTDLRGASLVGASGYAFDPSRNRVRGLRVDEAGATGLLRAMGVLVE